MRYVVKLFGQIGRTGGYFDTGKTSEDWDALEARAERAEAELAFQVARNSDLFTQRDQIRAELDAERARLDWLEENAKDIMKYNCRSYIWFAHQNIRAAIDAATTEDAK